MKTIIERRGFLADIGSDDILGIGLFAGTKSLQDGIANRVDFRSLCGWKVGGRGFRSFE
jgi:hypothetical protein